MGVTDTVRRGSVDWAALIASVVGCQLAGIVPSLLTADDVASWYPTLDKPWFTPPGWVFGPVWTTLYLLMGVALYLVWRRASGRRRTVALGLFAVQLALNAAWSLVFFGERAVFGGLVVVLALLGSVAATAVAFARVDRRAGALFVPYLLWVGFATALNYGIWRLNA